MDKVKRAGRQLKWLVLFLLILSPVIYFAVMYWQGPTQLLHLPNGIILKQVDIGILENAVIYLLPAITPAAYWAALYFIYKLAWQYSIGEVFTSRTINWMRQVGIILLSTDFIYMLQIAIIGPALSSLGLTENFLIIELKLGTSIVGLFILLISRVMLIASDLDEQQQLTI